MLPGHYRMPFGEFQGYSLQRLAIYHKDYVQEFLADSELCANYPNIREFFNSSAPSPPISLLGDPEPEDDEALQEPEEASQSKRRGK